MKLLILVLEKLEFLNDLINELAKVGITGGTILPSTGLAHEMGAKGDNNISFIGSLRALLDPSRVENKTILMVLPEEKIQIVVDCFDRVVGDISKNGSGIIFTLPVEFTKGIKFY